MYDELDRSDVPNSGHHYHRCDCGWAGVISFRMWADHWFRCPECKKLYFIPYTIKES